MYVPDAAWCVCAAASVTVTVPLDSAWLWLGMFAAVNVTVFAPPVFSTVLKSVSLASTPTGTLPAPHSTQVPPRNVVAPVVLVVMRMDPTGKIASLSHARLEKETSPSKVTSS